MRRLVMVALLAMGWGAAVAVDEAGPGLLATYFKTTGFTQPVLTRVDARLSFPQDSATAPATGVPATNFSVRWQGWLKPTVSGLHSLVVYSDEGVQVWVGRTLVIDNLVNHSRVRDVGKIYLEAGKEYETRINYFQGGGTYSLDCSWIKPGASQEELIPTECLAPGTLLPDPVLPGGTGTGLQAVYFNNEDFSGAQVARLDPTVNFNWSYNAPATGVDPSHWSAEWRGQIEVPVTDTYSIMTTSAGSAWVYLDGKLLIDHAAKHNSAAAAASVALVGGKRYPIIIRYVRANRVGLLRLWWSSSSISPQIIPAQRFYPPAVDTTAFGHSATSYNRVSPAWFPGSINSAAATVAATVDGAAASVVRSSPRTWYATATAAGSPLGIPLQADRPVVNAIHVPTSSCVTADQDSA